MPNSILGPFFEIYREGEHKWGFRYVMPGGRILFKSDTYTRKARAKEVLLRFLEEVREPDSWLRQPGEAWHPFVWSEGNVIPFIPAKKRKR